MSNAKYVHNLLPQPMLWQSMKKPTLMQIHPMKVKKIAKTVKKAVKANHKCIIINLKIEKTAINFESIIIGDDFVIISQLQFFITCNFPIKCE